MCAPISPQRQKTAWTHRGLGWGHWVGHPFSYDVWLQCVSQPGRISLIPGISRNGFHSLLANNVIPNTLCLEDILLRIMLQLSHFPLLYSAALPAQPHHLCREQGPMCLQGPPVTGKTYENPAVWGEVLRAVWRAVSKPSSLCDRAVLKGLTYFVHTNDTFMNTNNMFSFLISEPTEVLSSQGRLELSGTGLMTLPSTQ